MGKLIYPLGIVATLIVLGAFRRFRRDPLIPSLLLWAFGYLTFLAYHNNLQPRYYLVVAIPLTLLVPILIEDLVTGAPAPAELLRRRRFTSMRRVSGRRRSGWPAWG